MKLSPNFGQKFIDHLAIYSDAVYRSVRLGDSLSNLLDLVSFRRKNIYHRPVSSFIFRPLKNNTLSQIRIEIYDKFGEIIDFPDNSFTAIELLIKPLSEISN